MRQSLSISAMSAAIPARCSTMASAIPAMPPPTIRTRLVSDIAIGGGQWLVAPSLLPKALTDGAGDARRGGRHRHDPPLRRAAGNFQHQLGSDRLLELLALLDRNDKR